MPRFRAWLLLLFPVIALLPAAFERTHAQGGGASSGVRCPDGFTAEFDSAAKVLKCRKEIVRWVVTTCPDKSFATYAVKAGADACTPTEIPGVGAPPGSKGSKPVECATSGYKMMTDRTAQRDRCKRTETQYALPLPAIPSGEVP